MPPIPFAVELSRDSTAKEIVTFKIPTQDPALIYSIIINIYVSALSVFPIDVTTFSAIPLLTLGGASVVVVTVLICVVVSVVGASVIVVTVGIGTCGDDLGVLGVLQFESSGITVNLAVLESKFGIDVAYTNVIPNTEVQRC